MLLTPDKTVRLIRKELGTYITSKITNAPTPPMIPGLENIVNELTSIGKALNSFLHYNNRRISTVYKTCN